MTLPKADLTNRIYTVHPDLSKTQAQETAETILWIMKSSLISGNDVLLSGFGKFSVKDKAPWKGRNPKTGEELMVDARRVVTFKPSGKLREKVNGK